MVTPESHSHPMDDQLSRIARHGGLAGIAAMRLTYRNMRNELSFVRTPLPADVTPAAVFLRRAPHAAAVLELRSPPVSLLVGPMSEAEREVCLSAAVSVVGLKVLKLAPSRDYPPYFEPCPTAFSWTAAFAANLVVLEAHDVHFSAGDHRLPLVRTFVFDGTYPGFDRLPSACQTFFDMPALERLSVGCRGSRWSVNDFKPLLLAPFTRRPFPSLVFLELGRRPRPVELPSAPLVEMFPLLATLRCDSMGGDDGQPFAGCRRLEVVETTAQFVLPPGLQVLCIRLSVQEDSAMSFAPGSDVRCVELSMLPTTTWWEPARPTPYRGKHPFYVRFALHALLPRVTVLDLRGSKNVRVRLVDLSACERLEELRYVATHNVVDLTHVNAIPRLRLLDVELDFERLSLERGVVLYDRDAPPRPDLRIAFAETANWRDSVIMRLVVVLTSRQAPHALTVDKRCTRFTLTL